MLSLKVSTMRNNLRICFNKAIKVVTNDIVFRLMIYIIKKLRNIFKSLLKTKTHVPKLTVQKIKR